ncbi:MAG: hypothetical protein K1X81_14250 [Bacteroidia bacterium]|nr:hypothetical protein [Bacteroidia bacterium]
MNYHKQLDFVLGAIAKMDKGKKQFFDIKNALSPNEIEHGELLVLLNHLVDDKMLNYIETDTVFNGDTIGTGSTYQITVHALLFLESSSYMKEKARKKRDDIWNIIKICAVTANALATLYLMYRSAYSPL